MINAFGPINTGQASGGAGAATANNTSTVRLRGKVKAVYVKYNDSCPATTDVTIATLGTSPSAPAQNILVITSANTSGWYYPRTQVHGPTGAALTYDGTRTVNESLTIDDRVKVTVAEADDNCDVDVWIVLEE